MRPPRPLFPPLGFPSPFGLPFAVLRTTILLSRQHVIRTSECPSMARKGRRSETE